jgi:putative ABC transport system substrate-binding protein
MAAAWLVAHSAAGSPPPAPPAPDAGSRTVLILRTSGDAPYARAEEGARSALASEAPGARLVSLTLGEEGDGPAAGDLPRDAALVVAIGSRAARVARERLPEIPVVYAMVLDPHSVALPGPGEPPAGNATGVSMEVGPEREFELLRQILPGARRVGVLYDPARSGAAVRRAAAAAAAAGLTLVSQPVHDEADVLPEGKLLAPNVDAVWLVPDPTVLTAANVRPLILMFLRARKPLFAMSEGFVRNGAVAALIADPSEVGRRAGRLAGMVLQGTPVAALRPEPPPRTLIVLNQASAESLGIALPAQILTRAHAVHPIR